MTRKITTLLVVLACSISSMMAQRVASLPTALTSLTDGYYVIVAKSSKTNTNGNFLYTDGTNVRIDNKSKDLDKLGQVFSNTDNNKYIWKVTHSDNSMTIQSYSNNKYWNRYSHVGTAWDKESIVDRDRLETGNSVHTYTIEASGNNARLTIDNHYGTFAAKSKTVYVTDCSDGKSTDDGYVGYRRTPGTDVMDMSFYAVELPEQVSFTYNYVEDGTIVASKQMTAYTLHSFPSIDIPDFVTTTTSLEGLVTSEDNGKTFNIDCSVNLPFATGKLYYLQGNISTESRMTVNGSLGTHTSAEQPALNDIANDLWYVEGNAFDGFKFYNVATGKYLTYTASAWGGIIPASVSMSDEASAWKVRNNSSMWDGSLITDGMTKGFALTAVDGAALSSSNFVTVGSSVSLGTANNAATLMLIEPTLSLKLNYSAADEATFATTCLPYNVEVAEGDAKLYVGQLNSDKSRLEMVETTILPANEGAILRSESAENSVVLRIVETVASVSNDLQGTTSQITDMSNILSFGRLNGNGKVGFFRSTNDHLSANRAYILADEATQAIAMNFGGTTTAINNATIAYPSTDAAIYDLSGHRVSKVEKGGVYIQRGIKFMAK